MTFTEAWGFLSGGGPVVAGIFMGLVLLQLFSERVSQSLGPIFGSIGRWWHGRGLRDEERLQKELAARAATKEQQDSYQLKDMERQLAYFLEVVEKLRVENGQLRDELHTVHRLLDEARKDVGAIKRTIDTGERIAALPPVRPQYSQPIPPLPGGRHGSRDEPDETSRIR